MSAEVTEVRVGMSSLASLRELVGAATTPLVWLIDSGAEPTEDALPALLEHAPGPAASVAVDAHGQPIKPLIGRALESDQEGVLAAVQRHRVPLRHIPLTSLLVERALVLDLAAPDPGRFGPYAGAEWTGRLFARRRGMLVPASRVHVAAPPAGSPLQVLRVARSADWGIGETVRELQRTLQIGVR